MEHVADAQLESVADVGENAPLTLNPSLVEPALEKDSVKAHEGVIAMSWIVPSDGNVEGEGAHPFTVTVAGGLPRAMDTARG